MPSCVSVHEIPHISKQFLKLFFQDLLLSQQALEQEAYRDIFRAFFAETLPA